MIAFRIEAVTPAPVLQDEGAAADRRRAKAERIEELNGILLDLFEERPVFWVQLAEVDGSNTTLLAFASYTSLAAGKGKINAEADFLQIWERLPVQGSVTLTLVEEIRATEFYQALKRYEIILGVRVRDMCKKQLFCDFDRYHTEGYQMTDRLAPAGTVTDRKTAKAIIKKLLPDDSMIKEVDRIFCSRHPKQIFYGIPVHYKISTKSDVIADKMIDDLVNCLYCSNRILSRRITKIDQINDRLWDKDELLKLFQCSQNAVVEIVLTGDVSTEQEYASRYHRVSDMLAEYVREFSGSVLFFFVENASHPGFARQLLGKVDEDLDIIEIQEGVGNARQAAAYFMDLLAESNMQRFFENEVVFTRGKFYSATEVRSSFNQWRKARLKDRVYSAYGSSHTVRTDQDLRKKGAAFDELQRMAGLAQVKEIIVDIIAAYKVQKLRDKYYSSNEAVTRHMVFTGNPGTAKTTVARLLAEILKENGILKTGAFIECGRADLVGQYVGWTAQIVKEKFSQAQGGILFIDEAYSLVEGRAGLFGDEAINTIVQEMENKRGEVIVVFAGYPERMREFIDRNEGLRSRIAFHVDFPDYNPEELMGILEKILEDKQYVMTSRAKARARRIFERVCTQKEYGNGRFVRNMFEQAVNRQAARIAELAEKEIDREKLFELREADLDVNIVRQYEKEGKRLIGFAG